MEARMYLEDARLWTRENDWRKFTKRGFLLSRSAYEDVDGFDASHLRFAEITIAAKLHCKRYRLGFASGAAITHYNSTALWELLDYVWEFRRLERRVAQVFPDLLASPASSDADAELVRACRDPEFRSSAKSALKKPLLFALRTIGRADSRLMAKLIANLWVQFSIGPRFGRLMSVGRAASRFLCAWLRFHLPQSDDRTYAAYKQVWQSFGDLSVANSADFFSDPHLLVPLAVGQVCRIGEQSGVHFVGFHSTENWNGTAFRWSGVLSALRFELAEEPPIIALSVLPVRSLSVEELFVYWNGVRLNHAGNCSTPTRLVYTAGGSRARKPEARADLLTLICVPMAPRDSADRRVLGIPLISVERLARLA
jgi:hypothetical protein